jgi:hypothetical protein
LEEHLMSTTSASALVAELDVIAALALARRAGLEVSIRGGGHNVAGRGKAAVRPGQRLPPQPQRRAVAQS